MAQEVDSSGWKFAHLPNLPIEVLQPLLSFLPKQDVKSVRLASRLLADKATPILFNSIRISTLKADRDAFFKIADSPHLVRHVCTVVWEELNGDHTRFEAQYWDRSGGYSPFSSDQLPVLAGIVAQMRDLFWVTTKGEPDDFQEAFAAFLPQFITALDRMPNLHTLVSKPMHDERQVQAVSSGYPITARVIKRLIHHDQERCTFNTGFLAALVPALVHMARQPGNRVTRLLFADETTTKETALRFLPSDVPFAFSKLEYLDFCISGTAPSESQMKGFRACLEGATNVSYLHLCREAAYQEDERSPRLLQMIPKLPRLTEVHLDDIMLGEQESDFVWPEELLDDDNSALVKFVRLHANTLRKLRITSSKVTRRMLLSLHKLNSLQLERFIIVPGQDMEEDNPWPTSERTILGFVNKRANGKQLEPDFGPDDQDPVCTHDAVWCFDEWPTAAVFDTRQRGWRTRGYEPLEVMDLDDEADERRDEDGFTHELGPCRVHDHASGLWVDRDGVWYDPRTDEEILQPERRSYESERENEHNPWAVKNERVWDWELGLWRDLGTASTGPLHRFAVDRNDTCEVLPERIIDDEAFSDEDDEDVDMRPFYAREDDDHVMRQLRSSRWGWGRDEKGRIWYWEVLGNKGHGFLTEKWHFRHRNGEEAYGEDPLEFWSDWQGSEAGDVAEATPFGWRFEAFVDGWSRDTSSSDLPPKEETGQLYGEPVLWEGDRGQLGVYTARLPADLDMDDISEITALPMRTG
ncbi:hypothetical protein B0J15DRAFT_495733 [Fusarium solani]|uniref:F-box domain-containing protein n=1 Tax=Fusarium solani TaxID=169388 RepID=A0A9P9KI49_FUSSL|nr:uncharacterized protein B0J15DRAFT_495733 [Fusarium solani]KAH7253394.1 hypothetical protein B0J15DRAFT_495733 [Fusarium solani]